MKDDTLETVIAVAIVLIIALVIAGIILGWIGFSGEDDETIYRVSVDDDPVMGVRDAPVEIIEFSDFSCSFCATFSQEVKPLLEEYVKNGTVRFAYRDFPLTSIHPKALQIAKSAGCVQEQSDELFWEFHDVVYENLGAQEIGQIRGYAELIGANMTLYDECYASERRILEVQRDIADGRNVAISGTPTFFINGVKHTGFLSREELTEKIEAVLERQQS